jgi:hypothetical protein
MTMQMPRSSLPRRPARPDICTYSPDAIQRCDSPSHLRVCVKTTVRAGMFKPIANVSVANSTLISCAVANATSAATKKHT